MFSKLITDYTRGKSSWKAAASRGDAHSSVVLIGIGNEFRSDDGVGILLARRLREKKMPGVVVQEHSGEGVSLIDLWNRHDSVFLMDAVSSGSLPGTVTRLDLGMEGIPHALKPFSTHAFGVGEGIGLARNLDRLPARLIMYGIEGRTFTAGTLLSPDVSAIFEEVVQLISAELSYLAAEVNTLRNGSV